MRKRAVSLAGALTLILELGMFRAPEPRLILHVYDPFLGDQFLTLSGPLEANADWAEEAIAQLRDRLQAETPGEPLRIIA